MRRKGMHTGLLRERQTDKQHCPELDAAVEILLQNKTKQNKNPWPLVRKRTIQTERSPLVDEI
jgi:hypothetical protein